MNGWTVVAMMLGGIGGATVGYGILCGLSWLWTRAGDWLRSRRLRRPAYKVRCLDCRVWIQHGRAATVFDLCVFTSDHSRRDHLVSIEVW